MMKLPFPLFVFALSFLLTFCCSAEEDGIRVQFKDAPGSIVAKTLSETSGKAVVLNPRFANVLYNLVSPDPVSKEVCDRALRNLFGSSGANISEGDDVIFVGASRGGFRRQPQFAAKNPDEPVTLVLKNINFDTYLALYKELTGCAIAPYDPTRFEDYQFELTLPELPSSRALAALEQLGLVNGLSFSKDKNVLSVWAYRNAGPRPVSPTSRPASINRDTGSFESKLEALIKKAVQEGLSEQPKALPEKKIEALKKELP